MEIIKELREIPSLSLALGFFDGLHLGHQEVIKCAVEFAKEANTQSAVVTFAKHPRCYLNNIEPKYILTKEDKYNIMGKLGVDYVVELDFPTVSSMTPDDYIKNIIVKYFSPKAISTGFNHHFGINRTGGVKFFLDNQYKYNFVYLATPPENLYGDIISSTAIRGFIKKGLMYMANDMLGRKFSIKGKVVEGQKIGQTLGFPTANIIYPEELIEPAYGVYITEVRLENGEKHKAIANFGVKPTFSSGSTPLLEVHIPDFSGNLYNQTLKVKFLKYLRSEVKFRSADDLKMQISFDLQKLKNYH